MLRDELVRREVPPPVAAFAAFCAALAACSKSFLKAPPNFVVSRRASETNLPNPLYRVLVLVAASRPVWLRRSVSAFCAASSDWDSRLSAAGSLKLAPLRDEERVDFRACGTRSPQTKTGRREPNRASRRFLVRVCRIGLPSLTSRDAIMRRDEHAYRARPRFRRRRSAGLSLRGLVRLDPGRLPSPAVAVAIR